jgi:hypothetical protein
LLATSSPAIHERIGLVLFTGGNQLLLRKCVGSAFLKNTTLNDCVGVSAPTAVRSSIFRGRRAIHHRTGRVAEERDAPRTSKRGNARGAPAPSRAGISGRHDRNIHRDTRSSCFASASRFSASVFRNPLNCGAVAA